MVVKMPCWQKVRGCVWGCGSEWYNESGGKSVQKLLTSARPGSIEYQGLTASFACNDEIAKVVFNEGDCHEMVVVEDRESFRLILWSVLSNAPR